MRTGRITETLYLPHRAPVAAASTSPPPAGHTHHRARITRADEGRSPEDWGKGPRPGQGRARAGPDAIGVWNSRERYRDAHGIQGPAASGLLLHWK
jgi:hypothetical protein